jgi:hypothetical protein
MRRDALRTMLFRAALASSLQLAFGDRMHRVQSYWWQRRIGSQMCPRDCSRKAAMACDPSLVATMRNRPRRCDPPQAFVGTALHVMLAGPCIR